MQRVFALFLAISRKSGEESLAGQKSCFNPDNPRCEALLRYYLKRLPVLAAPSTFLAVGLEFESEAGAEDCQGQL
jgi:hypothetical protein